MSLSECSFTRTYKALGSNLATHTHTRVGVGDSFGPFFPSEAELCCVYPGFVWKWHTQLRMHSGVLTVLAAGSPSASVLTTHCPTFALISTTAAAVGNASATGAAARRCHFGACALWTQCASVQSVPWCLTVRLSFMTSSSRCS